MIQVSSGESGGDAAHFPLVQTMEEAGSCWARGNLGLLPSLNVPGVPPLCAEDFSSLLIHGNFACFPHITLHCFSLAELFPAAESQNHKIVQYERNRSGVIWSHLSAPAGLSQSTGTGSCPDSSGISPGSVYMVPKSEGVVVKH